MAQPQPAQTPPPPFQQSISTDEELEVKLAEPGIKVVEVFSWAGPCKAVVSAFKKLLADHDDAAALQFLKVEADKCQLIEEIKQHAKRSLAKFLIFEDGLLKHDIEGPDTFAIAAAVKALFARANDGLQSLREAQVNPFAAAIAMRAAAAAAAAPEQPATPEGGFKQLLAAVSSQAAANVLGPQVLERAAADVPDPQLLSEAAAKTTVGSLPQAAAEVPIAAV